MAMKIITGYTGGSHITPADDAGLHKGIFGAGDYVLNVGSQFAATTQTNTEIKIADGELIMQGRHARNDSGGVSISIANGTQGMYRNDLIVARYTKGSNSVEEITLMAITGTATSGTATDPEYNKGDIETGQTRDFPLYRVKLNGISISSVEQLWKEPTLPIERGGTGKKDVAGIKSLLGLAKAAFVDLVTVALGGTGKTSHTSNAVLTGNGTNAVNNVATANGAFYATAANGAAKFGTLPIAQGGTNATTAANARNNLGIGSVATENILPITKGGTGGTDASTARANLGINSSCFIKHAANSINIDNTDGNWNTDITQAGHGTVPDYPANVTQTTGGSYYMQTARIYEYLSTGSHTDYGRLQRILIRDKPVGITNAVWSNWKEILTEENGMQKTLLWTNSSPTSNFGSQIIGLTLSGYDAVEIVALYSTSTVKLSCRETIAVDNSALLYQIANFGANDAMVLRARKFEVTTTGINVGFSFTHNFTSEKATESTEYIVPLKIYGVKW